MSDKLRPCKCGARVEYNPPEDADGSGWIFCRECCCEMSEMHFETTEEFFAAWNRRASGWRPIAEAPKDGQVLAAFKGQFGWVMFLASWSLAHNRLYASGYAEPTHFMLITPPEETNG